MILPVNFQHFSFHSWLSVGNIHWLGLGEYVSRVPRTESRDKKAHRCPNDRTISGPIISRSVRQSCLGRGAATHYRKNRWDRVKTTLASYEESCKKNFLISSFLLILTRQELVILAPPVSQPLDGPSNELENRFDAQTNKGNRHKHQMPFPKT